jgi:non-specific serine/threonine protein kinase
MVNEWTTLEPLPFPVRAASAAAVDGRIYMTGGQTADGVTRKVEVYEVARRHWRSGPALPVPLFNHSTVSLGGTLYVLGGYDQGRERRDLFAYRPGGATGWRRLAPLPRPVHAFGAVAFRGEIWAIGGRRGERILRAVWIYDPRRDHWRAGPTLPRPMELLGATAAGDRIYAVWEHTYQVYDAGSGRWRQGPRRSCYATRYRCSR